MRKQVISLWDKKAKNGKPFISGIADLGLYGSVSVVFFRNDKKTGNQPDWYGYLSESLSDKKDESAEEVVAD